jgi:beta-glucosidase
VADLLARMTLEEKLDMLGGSSWMDSRPIPRLGIPAIKMADGPMGVRSWAGPSAVTATNSNMAATSFPAGVALASTWDPDLAQQVGRAVGQEVRALGRDMLLGPCVNIHRGPGGGRNFESYGEDPYLASRMVVGYIKGVQGEGVIATVKHFAANNQEFERHTISAKADKRTLQEIYFPAFRAAVEEAGVWSVMSAYNKVNGQWCAENPYLLTEVLKEQWKFKGFVVSDWGGTHSVAETLKAGLDLEMPGADIFKTWMAKSPDMAQQTDTQHQRGGWLVRESLMKAVSSGQLTEAAVDDKVRRLLRAMFANGLFDQRPAPSGVIDTPEQVQVARKAAAQGMVLLKNAGPVLPITSSAVRSLAVIGPNANVARTGGGGSSLVRPKYSVRPLEGIQKRAGGAVQVSYALGCRMEGEDKEKDTPQARAAAIKEAVELASKSDMALIFAGYDRNLERESADRTLGLPAGQDDLIAAVAKANQRTVVVVNSGGPVLMNRWIEQVPAIVAAWYPGQEAGSAIADVLFGDANFSGKLPVTFLRRWEDSPAYGNYPGKNGEVAYAEGIYVGYRHFDKKNIAPLFPFGHGLSYTSFEYSGLKAAPGEVSFTIKNTGKVVGAEVAQVYAGLPAAANEPPQRLVAHAKGQLAPGESKAVTLKIDPQRLSVFNTAKDGWETVPGQYQVLVGASSRDIRLKGAFELK